MNERELARYLRQLAAEQAEDTVDPWPAIRRRIAQRRTPHLWGQIPRWATRRHTRRSALIAAGAAGLVLATANALPLVSQPRAASAEVLDLVQREATGDVLLVGEGADACPPAKAAALGRMPADKAARAQQATETTDRLGEILGVSGEQVREAMRQAVAMQPLGNPPLSKTAILDGVARDLGVSPERVREAFSDARCPGTLLLPKPANQARINAAAQALGVSPVQLEAALRRALPTSTPADKEALLDRMAQNLGVTPERLRQALEEVAGSEGKIMLPLPKSLAGQR